MLKKLAQKFISFKKKDENSALISVGLVIMLLAVFLIKMGNANLPEDWKSEVEIWGTVSDWFIVIITLVTAVFLYKTLFAQNKTLDSQLKVQEEQNRLFKIEELKYLRTIKPKVSFSIYKLHKVDNNTLLLTHLELTINLTTVNAKNMYHKIHTPHPHAQQIEGYGDIKGKKINLPKISEGKESPQFTNLLIEMTYEDCDGNKYLYKKELMYLADTKDNFHSVTIHESEDLIKTVY